MPNFIEDSSFETLTGYWEATGPATLSRVASASAIDGNYVGRLEMTGSGTPTCRTVTSKNVLVRPGVDFDDALTFSCYVRWAAGAIQKQVRINVHYLTKDGSGAVNGVNAGGLTDLPVDGSWLRIVNNDNIPGVDAYQANLRILINSGTAGDAIEFDAAMFEPGNYDPANPYVKREDEVESGGSLADQTARWLRSSNFGEGSVQDMQYAYLKHLASKAESVADLQRSLNKPIRRLIRKSEYV